jgi:LysM repeat protein
LALAGSVLAVTVFAGRAAGTSAVGPAPGASVVVRAGDTVWAIARERVGPEGDPRPLVQAIRNANGLGAGPLLAGQRIVLPPTP